jgi:hypothetical protein
MHFGASNNSPREPRRATPPIKAVADEALAGPGYSAGMTESVPISRPTNQCFPALSDFLTVTTVPADAVSKPTEEPVAP